MGNDHSPPPYREIFQDLVVDYLIAKGVRPECPSCGHGLNEIHVRANGSVTVVSMPGIDTSDRGTALMNPHSGSLVIICECENCGHFRHFSYPRILAWVSERKPSHE